MQRFTAIALIFALVAVAFVHADGYASYDQYEKSDCSGTPSPAARVLSCITDSDGTSGESTCNSDGTAAVRTYSSGGCTGSYTTETIKPNECVTAPGSDGQAFIKMTKCSSTGALPTISGSGFCMDSYTQTGCKGERTASACRAIKPCEHTSSSSFKVSCGDKAMDIFSSTDCSGSAIAKMDFTIGGCMNDGTVKVTGCSGASQIASIGFAAIFVAILAIV